MKQTGTSEDIFPSILGYEGPLSQKQTHFYDEYALENYHTQNTMLVFLARKSDFRLNTDIKHRFQRKVQILHKEIKFIYIS